MTSPIRGRSRRPPSAAGSATPPRTRPDPVPVAFSPPAPDRRVAGKYRGRDGASESAGAEPAAHCRGGDGRHRRRRAGRPFDPPPRDRTGGPRTVAVQPLRDEGGDPRRGG